MKGTRWVAQINGKSFDSYGITPPKKLPKLIIKQNGHCLFSKYKIQSLTGRRDSYCAAYCFQTIYLSKVVGIHIKASLLNIFYQMIQ